MHRIGGIEKQDGTGNVNYDPANHELMTHIRADKVARHRQRHPAGRRSTATPTPRCSCSAGAARGARSARRCAGCAAAGDQVAHAHLVHLNPFPANLGEVLARYPKVLVPEMNLGQLSQAGAGGVPRRRASRSRRCRACRSAPPRSRTKILEMIDA